MKKFFKKLSTIVCCAVMAAVMSVTAAADIVFDMGTCYLEPVGGTVASGSDQVTVAGTVDAATQFITVTYLLEGDMTELEFWNNSNGTVSCEVRLETEGADVYACMPAFTSGWAWVNPTDTPTLKYNEWVTISETMVHFYDGFDGKIPARVLVQIRGNVTGEEFENVQVSFRNFRINGVSVGDYVPVETTTTTPATTTTVATTTTTVATTTTPEPEETTTEPEETTTEPEETTTEPEESAESDPEESTETVEDVPEDTATEPAATTTEPVETTTAPATTAEQLEENEPAETTRPPMSSIDYSQFEVKTDASDATSIVIAIVIIAVVVVIAAVIGFIIYKKMKFY